LFVTPAPAPGEPGSLQPRPPAKTPSAWSHLAFRLALGLGLALAAPLLLGLWLDSWAGSSPWASLCGVGAGIFIATFIVVITVLGRYRAAAPPEDSRET